MLQGNVAQGGEWQLAADDSDYDTMFEWKREGISASVVTLSWSIPANAVPGWYTMRYSGSVDFVAGMHIRVGLFYIHSMLQDDIYIQIYMIYVCTSFAQ